MEDFKDVMLSEPPAARAAGDGGGHRSFENFKGILLCDRPTDHRMVHGVAEQPFLPPGRPDRDLFGMPGQELEGGLGLQPSQEKSNRHNVARQARLENSRNVAPTALSKHRKWLKSLSEETKKLKLDAVEQELVKDDKQKRFQETERRKRKIIRSERASNDLDGNAAGHALRAGKPDPYSLLEDSPPLSEEEDHGGLVPTPPRPAAAAVPADEDLGSLPQLSPASAEVGERRPSVTRAVDTASQRSGEPKKKAKKQKPKWAMTKEEARDAEDEAFDEEMKDAQTLVDFFTNLDIEKVIDDPEIRESLSIALERIEEMADEQGIEASTYRRPDGMSPRLPGDDDASIATSVCSDRTAALERKALREQRRRERMADPQQVAGKDWDCSSQVEQKIRHAFSGDALKLAEQILAKSEGLRKVHSRQSLARILEELVVGKFGPMKNKTIPASVAVQEPVVSEVRPQSIGGEREEKARRILTALRNSKEYVQNLPYLYRCPSI
eukprot:Hpha_TRINITY_DN16479_c4_g1::TRINITY_DN16479_c4_g1_i8::g.161092::m.161092